MVHLSLPKGSTESGRKRLVGEAPHLAKFCSLLFLERLADHGCENVHTYIDRLPDIFSP
ncbi:hypothetical protein BLA18109_04680 [Burkholderia lata]|uniref:Uncharacterized protein n=1 Tax=Burkholderia lata (strain ATCC 17760 / DSM 23089 / LMG 22485 / NCIMB 9086 / R18194 / 383) TaxID=482957 RepID=A0A6P2X1I1_BURL3|nr:hypothetical protein BLA18109_04680 [Burkholderia lata]